MADKISEDQLSTIPVVNISKQNEHCNKLKGHFCILGANEAIRI